MGGGSPAAKENLKYVASLGVEFSGPEAHDSLAEGPTVCACPKLVLDKWLNCPGLNKDDPYEALRVGTVGLW